MCKLSVKTNNIFSETNVQDRDKSNNKCQVSTKNVSRLDSGPTALVLILYII